MFVAPRTDHHVSLTPALNGLFASIRDETQLRTLYDAHGRHRILGGKSARLLRYGDIIAGCELDDSTAEAIETTLTVLSVSATRFDLEAGLVYIHTRDDHGEIRSGYVPAARLVPTLSSHV